MHGGAAMSSLQPIQLAYFASNHKRRKLRNLHVMGHKDTFGTPSILAVH